jgi:hypothetical protein
MESHGSRGIAGNDDDGKTDGVSRTIHKGVGGPCPRILELDRVSRNGPELVDGLSGAIGGNDGHGVGGGSRNIPELVDGLGVVAGGIGSNAPEPAHRRGDRRLGGPGGVGGLPRGQGRPRHTGRMPHRRTDRRASRAGRMVKTVRSSA